MTSQSSKPLISPISLLGHVPQRVLHTLYIETPEGKIVSTTFSSGTITVHEAIK